MPKARESKISKLYQALLERLPSTYPQAKLIIHPSLKELRECYDKDNEEAPPYLPYCFCNANDETIHVSNTLYNDTTSLVVFYLAHEIGHLYAFKKYGRTNIRWDNIIVAEKFANDFANRWVNKLKKEGWLKSHKF